MAKEMSRGHCISLHCVVSCLFHTSLPVMFCYFSLFLLNSICKNLYALNSRNFRHGRTRYMYCENVDYLHFIDDGIGINTVATASQVTTGNEFDWLTLITP